MTSSTRDIITDIAEALTSAPSLIGGVLDILTPHAASMPPDIAARLTAGKQSRADAEAEWARELGSKPEGVSTVKPSSEPGE